MHTMFFKIVTPALKSNPGVSNVQVREIERAAYRRIAQVAKSESTVGQGYLQNGGELFIGIGHVLG